jgi:hypothetical protein
VAVILEAGVVMGVGVVGAGAGAGVAMEVGVVEVEAGVGVAMREVQAGVGVVDTVAPTLSCSGFMIEDDS